MILPLESEYVFSKLKHSGISNIILKAKMRDQVSLHCGGEVDVLVIPCAFNEIFAVANFAKKFKVPLYVIGNGTKLLVSDEGIPGIVLKISNNLSQIKVQDETIIAQAGAPLGSLINVAKKHGLSGLEYLAGIPGTVGGAIVMNAGTASQWVSQSVSHVKVMDSCGNIRVIEKNCCGFSYRNSIFQKNGDIILKVKFLLTPEEPQVISQRIESILSKRKTTIPVDYPNAGCIFKNPIGMSAAKLIDSVGLKGCRLNHAQISPKHANFIVNTGNASSNDIMSLINKTSETIKSKFNVDLELEIRTIGF